MGQGYCLNAALCPILHTTFFKVLNIQPCPNLRLFEVGTAVDVYLLLPFYIAFCEKKTPKSYCLATVMGDYTNPVYMRIFTHKHSVKALDLCSISYCRFQLDIEVYSI